MSTHEVRVVRLGSIESHPNADTLGITKIFGFEVCVKLNEFHEDDLVVYIEPDYVVPNVGRIRVKRLRGVYSQGLVIPAPEGSQEGDDVMEQLGIVRYEPPESPVFGGEDAKGPSGHFPVYDVENWRKWGRLFKPEEDVQVTEKIHGCNARFVWLDGQLHCGSRTRWKQNPGKNIWAKCIAKNPWIEVWCRRHEGVTIYGEIYGQVQNLKYGAGKNDLFFAAFDLFNRNSWMEINDEIWTDCYLPTVPLLYRGPYIPDAIVGLSEGKSMLANHIREGCVIRPVPERCCVELGRLQLKCVSNQYLGRE